MSSLGSGHANASWRSFFIALCVASIPLVLLALRFDFVCDDAYIAFRYSRHLAQGHGLVFNLGERPPVEGYSNFLWVLWLAPFEHFGFDVGWVARATSMACGLGLLAYTTRFVQRRFALDMGATISTALFFAVLPPVAMWCTGGLETMAFALCTFAVYERLCGDPDRPHAFQAGALGAIAVLLRADGVLWIGLVLTSASLALLVRRERSMVRASLITLAIASIVFALHLYWRESYYGELLPNTARVKAGLSSMRLERGIKYLASFFIAVPVCALVPLAAVWIRKARVDLATGQALFFLLGASSYALYTGGDFMPMGRFILPAMPFIAILFASALGGLLNGAKRPVVAHTFSVVMISLAALGSSDWSFAPESLRERFHFRWNDVHARGEVEMWRGMRDRAKAWSLVGRAIALNTEPTDSIVLGNIGAIGYYSDIIIHDVFGLTSPAVARRDAPLIRASPGHDKAVGAEFFYDLHPTYLNPSIVRQGATLEEYLGPAWRTSSLAQLLDSKRVEIESRPLRVEDGFAPGLELRWMRYRWDG